MKTGALCMAVLTALAAQQASAAFRNSCFGGRCSFRSGSNGYQGYQPRYSQNQYQGSSQNQYQGSSQNQYQGNSYSPRLGTARSPYGPSPSRFSPSHGGRSSPSSFSSSSSRFGTSPNHFGSSRSQFSSSRSHFSPPSSQFGPGQRHFSSFSSQLGSPSSQFGRFNRFNKRPSSLQSRFAGTTQEQRYQAQLATNRQLAQHRRQEQHLVQTRGGIVQPGTPSAALAAEKRADPKSLALGNQALQQILYLQNLVGAGR